MNGAMERPTIVADENIPSFSPLRSGEYLSATAAIATGMKIAVANPWKNLTAMSCQGSVTKR